MSGTNTHDSSRAPDYFTGTVTGFTDPQSALLNTEVAFVVHSTGFVFGPIDISPVKCTVLEACSASVQLDSIVALPFIWPVQTRSAVIPPGFIDTLLT